MSGPFLYCMSFSINFGLTRHLMHIFLPDWCPQAFRFKLSWESRSHSMRQLPCHYPDGRSPRTPRSPPRPSSPLRVEGRSSRKICLCEKLVRAAHPSYIASLLRSRGILYISLQRNSMLEMGELETPQVSNMSFLPKTMTLGTPSQT